MVDREKLNDLLAAARKHRMTPEEREAQRMSWVVGELMLQYPELTRDEAVRRYQRAKEAEH